LTGDTVSPAQAHVRANQQIEAETDQLLASVVEFMRAAGVKVNAGPPALRERIVQAIARGAEIGAELAQHKDTMPAAKKSGVTSKGDWESDAKTPARRFKKPSRSPRTRTATSRHPRTRRS